MESDKKMTGKSIAAQPLTQGLSVAPAKASTIPVLSLLLYIVFTYFPVIYQYVPILGTIKIVLIAGIVMLMSYLATSGNYTNRDARKNIVVYLWVVIIVMMTSGLIVSVDRGTTFSLINASLKYLLVFWVTINVIDTPRRLHLLLKTFVFCAVGMSLFTIRNYFFEADKLVMGYRAIAMNIGVFGDPNDLALLNNTALPFTLYYTLKSKRKFIPLAGFAIILTATVLTYSRGGFLGFCTTIVAFVLFFAAKRRKMILLFLLIVAVAWNLTPDTYKERIGTITDWKVDRSTGMTGTRMDAWKIVFTKSLDQPILGFGAGCSYYVAGGTMKDWHLLHNTFLQIFSELGGIAFICYLGLYLAPWRQYLKLKRAARSTKKMDLDLSRLVLVSLASYGTTVIFLPQAYSPLLYTISAIHVAVTELNEKAATAESANV